MKKRVITWALIIALTAAVPAFGIFGIPSPEDLLIWFVLRPMMHGNQRAMISNQVRELEKLVEQLADCPEPTHPGPRRGAGSGRRDHGPDGGPGRSTHRSA